MRKLLLLMALPLLFVAAKSNAQNNKVKPNYELAERFSPKKIGRMVKQTRVPRNMSCRLELSSRSHCRRVPSHSTSRR